MFQSSDETVLNISSLKPVESESILIDQIYRKEYKPFNIIQYWVNTGYLPYKKLYIDKNTQSDIVLSHSNEVCLSSSHKSSSSSVDTATYILSNMNTTNKIETMAIIEGAKHNAIENIENTENTENTEKLQITANNMHEKNNEHTENNNGNDQQYCMLNETHKVLNHVLQEQNIDIEKNISQLQKNVDLNNDDTVDMHDKLINNNLNKNSCIEQNSSNITNSLELQNSIIKRHRKKLYTGRNSPVDLINIRSNNKNTIFQSKRNLHPALDFECTLSKRYKIWKKRKSQFSIYNKYLMNNTQFNTSSLKKQRKRSKLRKTSIKNNETICMNNNTIQKNSKINRQSMKCNIDQSINRVPSINDLTNIKNKFNELINYEEKINVEQHKETNDITKKINLNPIIYLTRLSKDDIEKYKGSGKSKENINNSIQLSINNQKHKKLSEMIKLKNLTVCLTRLSTLDIEKYKKSKNVLPKIINSNLNVCLEQLPEIEIQKYKNINNKELSKNDLISRSIQSHNDNINIHKFVQRNTLNCVYSNNDSGTNSYSNINLITEDTNSDQSTVLIYKCSNTSFDLSSSLSVLSETSSQFDFSKTFDSYILKSKERVKSNEKERKNKVFSKKINTTEKSIKNKIGRTSDKNQPNHIVDKNKYNIKNKKLSNINDSCKKSSNINKNIFLNENVYQNINSITLSSNKSEISSESSNIYTSNKKKRPRVVSSDEEDFVHCLKDTQKLKLKHYKMLNQNLNNMNKKTRKNIIKYSNLNTSLNEPELLTKNIRTQEEDVSSIKKQKSLQQYNLSMGKDCNQSIIKTQTVIKDQIKKLSKVNTSQIAKKSHVSHLLFKTKIFSSDSEDSDSEYLTE